MEKKEIDSYISTRYEHWLDYANYQCRISNLPNDEGNDLLNEVLFELLKKPMKVKELYSDIRDNLRGLDFFILRTLKMNATSKTAPYRWKYHKMPLSDKDVQDREETEEEIINPDDTLFPEQEDSSDQYLCRRMEVIRQVLSELKLSEKERDVFSWKILQGQSLSRYPGGDVYKLYRRVKDMVILRTKRKSYGYMGVIARERKKANRIILEFKTSGNPLGYKEDERYQRVLRSIEKNSKKLKLITG